jgi:hypothetical protein
MEFVNFEMQSIKKTEHFSIFLCGCNHSQIFPLNYSVANIALILSTVQYFKINIQAHTTLLPQIQHIHPCPYQ